MHNGRPAFEVRHDPFTRSCHHSSPAAASGHWNTRFSITADVDAVLRVEAGSDHQNSQLRPLLQLVGLESKNETPEGPLA